MRCRSKIQALSANGSEAIWNPTFRWRRSAVKIAMMRSKVKLSTLAFLSRTSAFQSMEKRIAWFG